MRCALEGDIAFNFWHPPCYLYIVVLCLIILFISSGGSVSLETLIDLPHQSHVIEMLIVYKDYIFDVHPLFSANSPPNLGKDVCVRTSACVQICVFDILLLIFLLCPRNVFQNCF